MPTHKISLQETKQKYSQKAEMKEGYDMRTKRTLGIYPLPKFMVRLLETQLSHAIVNLPIHEKQFY